MKKKFIVIFLLVSVSFLFSSVSVFHDSPISIFMDRDTQINLEIRQGFSEIHHIEIRYRATGSIGYQSQEMNLGTETNPVCNVLLTDIKNFHSGMDYYFLVTTTTGETISLPKIQPEINPYRAMMKEDDSAFDGFILLSPDAEFVDPDEPVIIAISLYGVADQVNPDTYKLIMNGRDVTSEITVSDNMILYKPEKIKAGDITFCVRAKLNNGKAIQSEKWKVKNQGYAASSSFKDEFEYSGQVALLHDGYSKTTGDSLKDDSDNKTSFNMKFKSKYRWFDFNSKLFISSLEDKDKQSINRYNFQFGIPHLQLILGDYSPNYGTFVASGKNVRGFHTRVNLKNFRFFTSLGSSKRKIEGSVASDDTYQTSSFKRNTFTANLEIGRVDGFTYGLSFAKNKDDIESLQEKYYLNLAKDENNDIIEGEYDDQNPLLKPEDNLVLGTHANFRLLDNRLVFGGEAALSFFNSNIIGGAIPKDSLEADFDVDLPFDPEDFESLFIINKSVEPIAPNKSSIAYKTFLRAFFKRNLLDISYSAVGSSFHSLSTAYFQEGTGIFSLVDHVSFLNNQLTINAGMNLISDNIHDESEITTKSSIFFGNVSYYSNEYPSIKFGFNINNSENDAEDEEDSDINSEFYAVSNSFYFDMGYQFGNLPIAPTKLNIGYQNTSNQDKAYELYDNLRSTYSIAFRSYFDDFPLNTLFSFAITTNKDDMSDFDETLETNFFSFNFKADYTFADNRFKPYFDYRLTNYGGDMDEQNTHLVNLGTSYYFTANSFCFTELGMKTYGNNTIEGYDSSIFSWRIKLTQKF